MHHPCRLNMVHLNIRQILDFLVKTSLDCQDALFLLLLGEGSENGSEDVDV